MEQNTLTIRDDDRLGIMIRLWLQAKTKRTNSEATFHSYQRTMQSFRDELWRRNIDLDTDERLEIERRQQHEERSIDEIMRNTGYPVAITVEEWASTPQREGVTQIAPASHKQRLSVISSFYRYAIKQRLLTINPVAHVTYPPVEEYDKATPIDATVVALHLKAINVETSLGQRDLALLAIAFSTGRRAKEIENLSLEDITLGPERITLRWQRTKGGKSMTDELHTYATNALLAHVMRQCGNHWKHLPGTTPVWTSLSPHGYGERLTYWGIRSIYEKRLGLTKVHSSRHSFADYMITSGASVLTLMDRLGHKSLQVTQGYIEKLGARTNEHIGHIGTMLGFPLDEPGDDHAGS